MGAGMVPISSTHGGAKNTPITPKGGDNLPGGGGNKEAPQRGGTNQRGWATVKTEYHRPTHLGGEARPTSGAQHARTHARNAATEATQQQPRHAEPAAARPQSASIASTASHALQRPDAS